MTELCKNQKKHFEIYVRHASPYQENGLINFKFSYLELVHIFTEVKF